MSWKRQENNRTFSTGGWRNPPAVLLEGEEMEKKTAADIIHEIDFFKTNDFDHKDKLGWIQDVEERIQREIIDTHENPEGIQAEKVEDNTYLIAQGAYTDIYKLYIAAQIDKCNEEFDRYNNNMALFNGAYQSFELLWHNTHMPLGRGDFKL